MQLVAYVLLLSFLLNPLSGFKPSTTSFPLNVVDPKYIIFFLLSHFHVITRMAKLHLTYLWMERIQRNNIELSF